MALVPAPWQRTAQVSATQMGTQYTHGGTALGASKDKARVAQQGFPGPLDTRGTQDRVSAEAARRRRCGDTRVCPGTGGSGWSGTCGDRVGGGPCGVGVISTHIQTHSTMGPGTLQCGAG